MKTDVKTLLTGGVASTVSNVMDAMFANEATAAATVAVDAGATAEIAEAAPGDTARVVVQFAIALMTFIKFLVDRRRERKNTPEQ